MSSSQLTWATSECSTTRGKQPHLLLALHLACASLCRLSWASILFFCMEQEREQSLQNSKKCINQGRWQRKTSFFGLLVQILFTFATARLNTKLSSNNLRKKHVQLPLHAWCFTIFGMGTLHKKMSHSHHHDHYQQYHNSFTIRHHWYSSLGGIPAVESTSLSASFSNAKQEVSSIWSEDRWPPNFERNTCSTLKLS